MRASWKGLRLDPASPSTAADSQVNVKVWDVAPNGDGTLLARGCAMAPGQPGAERRVQFDLWHSAVEVPAGHRLEVWVQPTDSPTFRTAPQQVDLIPLIGDDPFRTDGCPGGATGCLTFTIVNAGTLALDGEMLSGCEYATAAPRGATAMVST